ncbi:hypothetical protein [[Mycobacterium] wendilense]|uniref:DUF222 domain-containing protein n=1 Tax=[Mycobacterium] wendilense TaxID=3064284 RepID=A0ABM9MCX6_9MYCO|nr:hypothetical protein [Mycolicibacterium sp. MU0050]CAJ1582208.1 hypothetical protein MU0050_001958 [Mycolicibacterium sp. MU0050]
MSGTHPDLGPELRQLAQAILDRLDPALRSAAALAAARSAAGPGRCQQVWCPVCALAALATGEDHPLIGIISEHSVALLEVVRALLDDGEGAGASAGPANPAEPPPEPPEPPKGRYEPIPVTVEE